MSTAVEQGRGLRLLYMGRVENRDGFERAPGESGAAAAVELNLHGGNLSDRCF